MNLNKRTHIGPNELECVSLTTFKFFTNKSTVYVNDAFKEVGHLATNTRAFFMKISEPLRKSSHVQIALFGIVPNIWNSYQIL